jgi:alpha-tubulin suppressor-like RCC1 family protein
LRGQDLYCWGFNFDGAVGAGIAGIHTDPQRVSDGWRSMALGRYHACGIKDDQVTCMGNVPAYPQEYASSPVVVTAETDWRTLTAADDDTCGVRADNAFCWGTNRDGRLGTGDDNSSPSPWGVGPVGTWSAIAAADYRTCGIREGELYCWGDNFLGFLGDGTEMNDAKAPVRIGTASDWTGISLGYDDSCGIRAGKLYCWGRNQSGLVGTGDEEGVHEPVQIGTATNWSAVTMGYPACGLRDGELYCWGPLSIGSDAANDPLTPTRVGSDADWTAISTFSGAICGLRNGGDLYCWGSDRIGQFPAATGPSDRFVTPMHIGTMKWDSIVAGWEYFCGTVGGTLYCWGSNEDGKLGIGPSDTLEPRRVGVDP